MGINARHAKAFARVNATVIAVGAVAHAVASPAMAVAARGDMRKLAAGDWLSLYASSLVKTAAFVVLITTTGELAVVAPFLADNQNGIAGTNTSFARGVDGYLPALAQALRWWLVFVLKSFIFEVIFDFLHYWGHRLSHEFPRLYRFHRSHHKFLHPNPLATYQQHPYDIVFTNLVPNVVAVLLLRNVLGLTFGGFDYTLLMCYKVFVEIAGHAGVESTATSFPQCAPLPQALGIELRTYDHDLHHSFPGMACNFSKRFTLWDRLFGTYKIKPV
ncbi:Cholesterol 25-hydroxylase [Hondaea fermentalgiana]|uniref:Cholesterol 25-hydroxylase n=1 Tax=Hondaea fermentalgiana TaxID=2315210 RepID=A0A2R5GGV0_9STRA|nr:Cholesterol 25-hydroxylase [Hondaea fermentalgiana]|eukprot:GBG30112.1 Cholesterol 25-hydroxylase [Hondaea fermentalgiana]